MRLEFPLLVFPFLFDDFSVSKMLPFSWWRPLTACDCVADSVSRMTLCCTVLNYVLNCVSWFHVSQRGVDIWHGGCVYQFMNHWINHRRKCGSLMVFSGYWWQQSVTLLLTMITTIWILLKHLISILVAIDCD